MEKSRRVSYDMTGRSRVTLTSRQKVLAVHENKLVCLFLFLSRANRVSPRPREGEGKRAFCQTTPRIRSQVHRLKAHDTHKFEGKASVVLSSFPHRHTGLPLARRWQWSARRSASRKPFARSLTCRTAVATRKSHTTNVRQGLGNSERSL